MTSLSVSNIEPLVKFTEASLVIEKVKLQLLQCGLLWKQPTFMTAKKLLFCPLQIDSGCPLVIVEDVSLGVFNVGPPVIEVVAHTELYTSFFLR